MKTRMFRLTIFVVLLSLAAATPCLSQGGNRNDQLRRQQQQQDQSRRQQAEDQRRRAQEEQRRQLQQWQQQQRQQMADQQRRQMLETQRQQRMAEMLRQKQNARLQDAMRAQQAGKPTLVGVPNAAANQATDRMVFPNGVAKLTRPLTPAEIRRGFTGKITPDGRALVKFRNRVFAVPASGLGLKLGSDPAATRAQLMSGTSLTPAPGTSVRLSVKEKTALTGTIQQLVVASNARQAQERVALAKRGTASSNSGSATGVSTTSARPSDTLLIGQQGVPNAGGVIRSFVTEKESVYYRVFSDNPVGSFLTAVPPVSRAIAIEGMALPPQNKALYIQEVRVPAGVRLQRSRALAAFGRQGGMEQFELLDKIPESAFGPPRPLE